MRLPAGRPGGGNPLLLTELTESGEVPETLRLVLGARLHRCGPDARRAMARLGLLGRPAPAALLGPGVPALLDAGLVERDPRPGAAGAPPGEALLVARHALLADAADAARRPGERARHLQLAADRVLAGRGHHRNR